MEDSNFDRDVWPVVCVAKQIGCSLLAEKSNLRLRVGVVDTLVLADHASYHVEKGLGPRQRCGRQIRPRLVLSASLCVGIVKSVIAESL